MNQPTIPTPDRKEAQRRREGQGPGEGLGVATRAAQKAQDKDAEDNKVVESMTSLRICHACKAITQLIS
jgi:hypothetical protein